MTDSPGLSTAPNPGLRERLDARIAEILEAGHMAGVGPKARNFEKEVHTWNPALPNVAAESEGVGLGFGERFWRGCSFE